MLSLSFRGVDVLTAPPNTQGFVLLQILKALAAEGLDGEALGADAATLARLFALTALDREERLLGVRIEHSWSELKDYLREYLDARRPQFYRPFIEGDPDPKYGRVPDDFVRIREASAGAGTGGGGTG